MPLRLWGGVPYDCRRFITRHRRNAAFRSRMKVVRGGDGPLRRVVYEFCAVCFKEGQHKFERCKLLLCVTGFFHSCK